MIKTIILCLLVVHTNFVFAQTEGDQPDGAAICPTCGANGNGATPTSPVSSQNSQNIQQTAAAAATAAGPRQNDRCASVPAGDRAGNGQLEAGDLMASAVFRCARGAILGIFGEIGSTISGIWNFIRGIWSTLVNPMATLSGLADILRDPGRVLNAFVRHFTQSYDLWSCYNARKKTEIICNSFGRGAVWIVSILFGPEALVPRIGGRIAAETAALGAAARVGSTGARVATRAGEAGEAVAAAGAGEAAAVAGAGSRAARTGVEGAAYNAGRAVRNVRDRVLRPRPTAEARAAARAERVSVERVPRATGAARRLRAGRATRQYDRFFSREIARRTPTQVRSGYATARRQLIERLQVKESAFNAARGAARRRVQVDVLRIRDKIASLDRAYNRFESAQTRVFRGRALLPAAAAANTAAGTVVGSSPSTRNNQARPNRPNNSGGANGVGRADPSELVDPVDTGTPAAAPASGAASAPSANAPAAGGSTAAPGSASSGSGPSQAEIDAGEMPIDEPADAPSSSSGASSGGSSSNAPRPSDAGAPPSESVERPSSSSGNSSSGGAGAASGNTQAPSGGSSNQQDVTAPEEDESSAQPTRTGSTSGQNSQPRGRILEGTTVPAQH